jgi:hypothetical protein
LAGAIDHLRSCRHANARCHLIAPPQVDFQSGIIRLEPGTTKDDEGRMFAFTEKLQDGLEDQEVKAEALK